MTQKRLWGASEIGKPRYQHDCDRCVFLGQYEAFDLYICPLVELDKEGDTEEKIGTVIARLSNRPGDYSSGCESSIMIPDGKLDYRIDTTRPLTEALCRALSSGFMPSDSLLNRAWECTRHVLMKSWYTEQRKRIGETCGLYDI